MLETQTVIAVAVISAITAGLVQVIKAIFGRNQNTKDQYDYQLKLVEAVNGNNEVLVDIKSELKAINDKISTLSVRVDKLEDKVFKGESE